MFTGCFASAATFALGHHLIFYRLCVVGHHLFEIVEGWIKRHAPKEIHLPAQEQAEKIAQAAGGRAPVEVLGVKHLLGVQQLAVKLFQRQFCGQDGVLDVEQPIIQRLNDSALR